VIEVYDIGAAYCRDVRCDGGTLRLFLAGTMWLIVLLKMVNGSRPSHIIWSYHSLWRGVHYLRSVFLQEITGSMQNIYMHCEESTIDRIYRTCCNVKQRRLQVQTLFHCTLQARHRFMHSALSMPDTHRRITPHCFQLSKALLTTQLECPARKSQLYRPLGSSYTQPNLPSPPARSHATLWPLKSAELLRSSATTLTAG